MLLRFAVLPLVLVLQINGWARSELELATVGEVRGLNESETAARPPVRLRGVITYTKHATVTDLTIQDSSGGVWISPTELPPECSVGSEVEVTGHVEPGGHGPIVQADQIRYLGPGTLPEPQRVSYEELLAPHFDGVRVEISGIIRVQRINPEFGLNWLALEVASGGGRVTINVTHEMSGQPGLVDAHVRIVGVCLLSPDARKRMFLPMINAHQLEDILVKDPPTKTPYTLPRTRLASIIHNSGPGHRIRVQGNVTLVKPGGSFFIQDESGGIQVFPLPDLPTPQRGETLNVIGYPELGMSSPVLRDADWLPASRSAQPLPLAFPEDPLLHDGKLITLRGELLSIQKVGSESQLSLHDGKHAFVYRLPGVAPWRIGSWLQVTGVCMAEVDDWEALVTHRQPQGFALVARGPEDVAVLKPGPWWTSTRLVWALVGLSSLLLCGMWWRFNQKLREGVIARERSQAHFNAILGERNRMAREIHDTLAQGFAGISMQLEALRGKLGGVPPDALRLLSSSQTLARENLSEARRAVWNLRFSSLEESGLAGTLARFGDQMAKNNDMTFDFVQKGEARPLPKEAENNILRIGQEAVTNAARHSGGTRITQELQFLATGVRLLVEDDGCGFEPASDDDAESGEAAIDGGFGLHGIRERAREMHAQLHIYNKPEKGVLLELLVPKV